MPTKPKHLCLKDIGKEEEEQDEANGQHIHEEQQHDAAVVEVPAGLDATQGIEHAEHCEHGGNNEQQRGAGAGEIRQTERSREAPEDQQIAAQQRPPAEIEDSEG